MKTIGFVPDPESAQAVVSWTWALAGDESVVEFLCWDRWQETTTRDAVHAALGDVEARITTIDDTEVVAAVVGHCRETRAQLLVTSIFKIPGLMGQDSDRLIRAAPCRAVVGRFGDRCGEDARRALIVVSESQHDRALLDLVRRPDLQVTVAGIEDDIGAGAEEVGRRTLERILRDSRLESANHIEYKVIVDNNPLRGIFREGEGYDLVLVGLDRKSVAEPLHRALKGPAVAVVKQAPPLRRRALPDWVPRIHPADYVDLVQDLRAGSRWGANFVVMLSMAAAIATLGLLQDSPAVVIGAMLVAPLMTPMIGFGLSVAQANLRLGSLAGKTIAKGILVTLAISFVLGLVVPGGELLSQETLARGTPNILDLGIALFSAVAAAFALARPGISGAIAGVAIATALVPPLCSVGISLAYGHWLNAVGASALFLTNLVAIMLTSAVTFLLMGVTGTRSITRHRRLAHVAGTVLVAALLVFSIPLGSSLAAKITAGSVRPIGYPVKRSVARAIQTRVEQESGVDLMFMARSSISGDLVIYVASNLDVSRRLEEDLTRIIREEMDNDRLGVLVFAVRLAWED